MRRSGVISAAGGMANHLYYGDNLDVLRKRSSRKASIWSISIRRSIRTRRTTCCFAGRQVTPSQAQIEAFEDTWHWNNQAEKAFDEVMMGRNGDVAEMLRAMRSFLKDNDMMAYLTHMAVRLVELHRVLKPTGSIYLHCDPTASHYLKLIMDGVFGVERFSNEIIWQRSTGKSLMTKRLPTNHDVILFYQKGDQFTWNSDAMFVPYDEANLAEKTEDKYKYRDADGRLYRLDNLINPNADRPNLTYEFLGVTKVWRWTRDRMQKAHEDGLVCPVKTWASSTAEALSGRAARHTAW